jgi:hypothetical protein
MKRGTENQYPKLLQNDELNRLATFRNLPETSLARPTTLARCGFVYDGVGDRVHCVSCNFTAANWNRGDNPYEIHRLNSPQCPFVLLADQNTAASAATRQTTSQFGTADDGDKGQAAGGKGSEFQWSTGARHEQGPGGGAGCKPSLWSSTSGIGYPSDIPLYTSSSIVEVGAGMAGASNIGRAADLVHHVGSGGSRLRIMYDTVASRLETFRTWPSGGATAASLVDPGDLARAGLFYTGLGDRVQCAYCGGVLRNWVRGDSPMDEHRRHYPDCPFVRSSGQVEQYVTTSVATSGNVRTTSSAATSCRYRRPQPKHPEFCELSARIQSFRGVRASPGQTADGLAAAGFYYIGPGDNVRCFQCGGGLKNFQPTNDPWTEHACWFPRCPFLLDNKDQQFIDSCRQTPAQNSSTATAATFGLQTEQANTSAGPDSLRMLDENRQLKEARLCKICMDKDVDTVFLPCGHLVSCNNCARSLRNCAICRTLIRGTVKVFLS